MSERDSSDNRRHHGRLRAPKTFGDESPSPAALLRAQQEPRQLLRDAHNPPRTQKLVSHTPNEPHLLSSCHHAMGMCPQEEVPGGRGHREGRGEPKDGNLGMGEMPRKRTRRGEKPWGLPSHAALPIRKLAPVRAKTREGGRERTLPRTDPPFLPSPLEDIILKIYFISQLHYGTTKSCESNLRTDYLLTYFI